MKLLCTAFDATLRELGIKGIHLSESAEVSSGLISHFRNDVHPITTDNLEKLLAAFDDEAFSYWISQVVKGRELKELLNSPIAIQTFISQLDNAAAVEVLHALANRLQDEAKKTAAHQ
jgi:DNA-binding Xre family transcriptional regulator